MFRISSLTQRLIKSSTPQNFIYLMRRENWLARVLPSAVRIMFQMLLGDKALSCGDTHEGNICQA